MKYISNTVYRWASIKFTTVYRSMVSLMSWHSLHHLVVLPWVSLLSAATLVITIGTRSKVNHPLPPSLCAEHNQFCLFCPSWFYEFCSRKCVLITLGQSCVTWFFPYMHRPFAPMTSRCMSWLCVVSTSYCFVTLCKQVMNCMRADVKRPLKFVHIWTSLTEAFVGRVHIFLNHTLTLGSESQWQGLWLHLCDQPKVMNLLWSSRCASEIIDARLSQKTESALSLSEWSICA